MGKDTPHEIRMKLDRRIHNQRVALRDNWEIVERRTASQRRWSHMSHAKLAALCDLAGIPTEGEFRGSHRTTFGRVQDLEKLLVKLMSKGPTP